MTLAAPLCPRRGVVDPIGVARRERALIETLRARPGAALGTLAEAAGHRLRRLAARGVVVRVAGRWRLAGEEPELGEAAPEPERLEPELDAQLRWVLPIGRYMRAVTSEFACVRYG